MQNSGISFHPEWKRKVAVLVTFEPLSSKLRKRPYSQVKPSVFVDLASPHCFQFLNLKIMFTCSRKQIVFSFLATAFTQASREDEVVRNRPVLHFSGVTSGDVDMSLKLLTPEWRDRYSLLARFPQTTVVLAINKPTYCALNSGF